MTEIVNWVISNVALAVRQEHDDRGSIKSKLQSHQGEIKQGKLPVTTPVILDERLS